MAAERIAALACAVFSLIVGAILALGYVREGERRSDAFYRGKVLGAVVELQAGEMAVRAETAGKFTFDPYRLFTRGDSRTGPGGRGADPIRSALEELEKTGRAFPGRPDAHYHRAKALLLLRREADALKALEEALSADQAFQPARILRAVLVERAGDHEGSLRELERARLSWSPDRVESWMHAHTATLAEKWKEAAEAYSSIIQLEAPGPESYIGATLEMRLGRGSAHLEVKEYLEAIEDFTVATTVWPGLVEPALLKGKTYHLLGNTTLAEKVFEETYRRAPFPEEVARMLVILHLGPLRDPATALEWADRLKDPSLRETSRLCCLNLLGRVEEAVEAGRKAIALDPRNAEAFSKLSFALKFIGDPEEAIAMVRRAVALDPEDPCAHAYLGVYLEKQRKFEASVEEYRESLRLDPSYVGVHLAVSRILAAQGRFEEALAAAEKAIEMAPECAMAHALLCVWFAALGRFEEAEGTFRKAVHLDPDEPEVYTCRGEALARQGRMDEAIEMVRKALELVQAGRHYTRLYIFPYVAMHRCSIARMLERQGRIGEAFEEYCRVIQEGQAFLHGIERLPVIIQRLEGQGSVGHLLDGVVEPLERYLSSPRKDILLLRTLALARLRGAEKRDPQKALEAMELALEINEAGGADNLPLLEDVLADPEARHFLSEQLEGKGPKPLADRTALLCIDAALASANPEELLTGARSGDGNPQRAYLEACLLQKAGKNREAAERLKTVAARIETCPQPVLRLAGCLQAAGDAGAAERELRGAIDRGVLDCPEIGGLWASVSLADLGRTPAEAVADFPKAKPEGPSADIRWLLDQLKEGSGVRINCGGADYQAHGGVLWGRDRFFRGGSEWDSHYDGISGTEDKALHQTVRSFSESRGAAGYHVPLPKGSWRVSLYFVETSFPVSGSRRFDVLIEGRDLLKDYEPLAKGFAVVDQRSFVIRVDDGVLDIGFVHGVENPQISAIEIEASK